VKPLNVAMVGATGVVGRTMLSVLEERSIPVGHLRLMASERSAGLMVSTGWGVVAVEDLAEADPSGTDLALFSAGADRSRAYAPAFVEAGAVVVDNSSAFRTDPDVPLVVVGVNDAAAHEHHGIIANPNCTTMALMMAAGPLDEAAGLRSMVVASYQSVSGTGQRGIDALTRQLGALSADWGALVSGGWDDPGDDTYVRPIGYNVVPFAGSAGEEGYTDEEWKLVHESRKILARPDLVVEPTCVRVPTVVGHGIDATMWFDRPIEPSEAAKVLDEASGIQVWEDLVPTPLDSTGIDDVLVGRIRATLGEPGGLHLWVVGDNLRKGAALNAVQIAEVVFGI
jgi:aspartate-semialdehyde dehydrogenase